MSTQKYAGFNGTCSEVSGVRIAAVSNICCFMVQPAYIRLQLELGTC